MTINIDITDNHGLGVQAGPDVLRASGEPVYYINTDNPYGAAITVEQARALHADLSQFLRDNDRPFEQGSRVRILGDSGGMGHGIPAGTEGYIKHLESDRIHLVVPDTDSDDIGWYVRESDLALV